jgi:hypothetical protein
MPGSRGSSRPPTGAATGSSPRVVGRLRRPRRRPDPARPAPAPVQYARSGEVSIAYQVLGSGPVDLVFVMGWVSHLEYFWNGAVVRSASFDRLAGSPGLILFDKRGTGCPTGSPTCRARRTDGGREGRVERGGLPAGGAARRLRGRADVQPVRGHLSGTDGSPDHDRHLRAAAARADYPWAPTPEDREAFCRDILEHWGGPVGIEARAPSVAADPSVPGVVGGRTCGWERARGGGGAHAG